MTQDPVEALVDGPSAQYFRIGLLVPQSGVLGLTGPSAIAAAVLAVEQSGTTHRGDGRTVSLVPIDAGAPIERVEETVGALVRSQAVDVLCGFHTSDVHRRVEALLGGRFPYLFTPPHEGGRRLQGVALMGSDPEEQLVPVVQRFAGRRVFRRWALVGSDYIWPRRVHIAARRMLSSQGASVVLDELVPLLSVNPDVILDRIVQSRAQAVLVNLVGRDLATFNRAMAASPIAQRVIRVSAALEETGLLEVDGDETGELYASMPWYASDPATRDMEAAYEQRWGDAAPRLGAYAAGCYEGVRLVAGLESDQLAPSRFVQTVRDCVRHRIPRLARAEGLELRALG